jgi:hypothetical protein
MSDSDSEDGGLGFFNPDMFTSNVEFEEESFQFGSVELQLKFVHNSYQVGGGTGRAIEVVRMLTRRGERRLAAREIRGEDNMAFCAGDGIVL